MDGNYALEIAQASDLLAQAVLSRESGLKDRVRHLDGDVKGNCCAKSVSG